MSPLPHPIIRSGQRYGLGTVHATFVLLASQYLNSGKSTQYSSPFSSRFAVGPEKSLLNGCIDWVFYQFDMDDRPQTVFSQFGVAKRVSSNSCHTPLLYRVP